ncbi:spore photoproduct lyase [Serpentinicella sp. ANB-PHB4]|uniref:spore photoproduct lyase n=1 Tax=Serpentinicella sp. ANB-PHB4 TaxID=3074076 RepID=UPI0028586287|nr:spore photoproduct lyase [Serpentinicella sp. ANB-PHB4]MDR5659143.1 spore photoproduct lyase [Serpentinicella sp. ANB-PHB4]
MKLWTPDRVYFEPTAKNTAVGQRVLDYCKSKSIPILQTTSHNQVRDLPGKDEKEKYASAKKTLVVGTKRSMKFDVCKPSAHYQFSLMTNCPGSCEYCYLFSTQGKKPYVRVYVNLDDIFDTVEKHIEKRLPHATMFEAASTGDPLAVEHITGTLKDTIQHFGTLDKGRLRVVTKYANVDALLNVKHNGHTRFRFSINSEYVTKNFEHNVHSLDARFKAANKVGEAGFPLGFIIAPIMIHENWREEYKELLEKLYEALPSKRNSTITFELIQHRFTMNAKNVIEERFPNTKLEMNPEERTKKWGKYGRTKYVYPKEDINEVKGYIEGLIKKLFSRSHIQYFT